MEETEKTVDRLRELVQDSLGEEALAHLDALRPEVPAEKPDTLVLHLGGMPNEAADALEGEIKELIPTINQIFDELTIELEVEVLPLVATAVGSYADSALYAVDGLLEQVFSVMDDDAVEAVYAVADQWMDKLRATMVGMRAHEQVALAGGIVGELLGDIYCVCEECFDKKEDADDL